MRPLSPKQIELKEKWDARITRQFTIHPNRYHGETAQEYALATVHWHHNVEFDKLHGEDKSGFFCREYSRFATEIWLWEVLQRLEADKTADPKRGWEAIAADEFDACNLRAALEAYELNDKAKT